MCFYLGHKFTIHPFRSHLHYICFCSGHIYTKNSLDRERDSEYNFFVVAKDKGEPVPQSSGAKVKVNLS